MSHSSTDNSAGRPEAALTSESYARPEAFDKRLGELEDSYRIPQFYLSDNDWAKVKKYGELDKRDRNYRETESKRAIYRNQIAQLVDLPPDRELTPAFIDERRDELSKEQRERLSELEKKMADAEELLETDSHRKLSSSEQELREELGEFVAYRAERYLHESRMELQQAPSKEAFEGFEDIADETDAALEGKETAKKPNFSVLALQEVQILLKRIFGKNHALKALFEQYVVLRYDKERSQRRAEAAHTPDAQQRGGAEISREYIKGKKKYVITVDDATFIERKTFRGKDGKEYSYPVANFVGAAFTIGRAILRVVFNNGQLEQVADAVSGHDEHGGGHHAAPQPFGSKKKPWPEKLLYADDKPNVVRPPGHEEPHAVGEGLDYLTLFLLDKKQAKKISAEWYGRAERLFDEKIGPEHMADLELGKVLDQPQLRADHEYVYRDYDVTRQHKSWLGQFGDKLAQTKPGMFTRLGLGGLAGGIAGSSLSGPFAWLGVGLGAAAGYQLAAPLKLFRTVQGVWSERLDFYYELAVSEHDKKEVSRIMAREENINDRDARLQLLLNTNNQEEMRRLLLADSETGDWALWRELLYLWKFDHLFQHSGGREISQEGFNLVTRLHRISNKVKRHGTKPSLFRTVRDEFGNTRYMLKSYGDWYANIKYEVEARSEREMMGVIQEAFEVMDDTEGLIPVDAFIGEDLDNPNSRGWKMGQVGDIRPLIGNENGRQYLSFLNGSLGKMDKRYLQKFDPYAQLIIKRYRKFDKGKFPGEHSKLIAVEAYEYYNDRLKQEEAEPNAEQEAWLEKLETKSIDEMLRQDDFEAEDVAKLIKQVEEDKDKRPFGGKYSTGRELEYQTIKAYLKNNLETLTADLERSVAEHEVGEQKGVDQGIGSEMGGLLKNLIGAYKGDLKGDYDLKIGQDVSEEDWADAQKAKRESFDKKLESAQKRVEYLLEHPDLDEGQRFRAHAWLARLTKYAPQVEAVAEFRRKILGRIYRYEVAAGHDIIKDDFRLNQLELAASVVKNKKARGNEDEKKEALAEARRHVEAFREEVEKMRQECISQDREFPVTLQEELDQLSVLEAYDEKTSDKFFEQLRARLQSFAKWFKSYRDDFDKNVLPERVKDEQRLAGSLMRGILHAREMSKLGESEPGEAEKLRAERYKKFMSINAIPMSRRNAVRDHGGVPDENDMLRYLKLAYAALEHKDRIIEAAKRAATGKSTKGEVIVDLSS